MTKPMLWATADRIAVPQWLIRRQAELQSRRYESDDEKLALVLDCAGINARERAGAPLASAIFRTNGELISVGVDAPGLGGHEMTNTLIVASNILGSATLRANRDWEMFSLAPPCLICLGNIYSERPKRFVCAVNHEQLLRTLSLPDTPMPDDNWQQILVERGILVQSAVSPEYGVDVMSSAR